MNPIYLRLSLRLSQSLRLSLSFFLCAFAPFLLCSQNVTIKKNPNNDNLIWPLNTSGSLFIGNGSGNVSTGLFNTAVGDFALNLNTSANSNTAIGNIALAKVTTGGLNTAVGLGAMYENLTGTENTALGMNSLYNNKGRSRSTAIGYKAMYYANNATSAGNTFNTAVGYESLNGSLSPANNTGTRNTTIGDQSMYSMTSGANNTAAGFNALYANTTGYSNVAIGMQSLYSNTVRANLVAVGDSALYKNGIGVTQVYEAVQNTAVGSKSLYGNTTGYQNTGIGFGALKENTTGALNTAVGAGSMYLNSTGAQNVAIGREALYSNVSGHSNVVIGNEAGRSTPGFGNVFIGNKAGRNETGSNKLYIANGDMASTDALIYGDFSVKEVRVNGVFGAYSTSGSQHAITGKCTYTTGPFPGAAGVYGENLSPDGYGIGVRGKGSYEGVVGEGIGTGNYEHYGVVGKATTANTGTNIGIYGTAQYGALNYAGYFDGDVAVVSSALYEHGINSRKSYNTGGNSDVAGVYGENIMDNNYGIGVFGKGGKHGVMGLVEGNSNSGYRGVFGESNGTNSGNNYGVSGRAYNSTANNYGLHGVAEGNGGIKYGVYALGTGVGICYGLLTSATGTTTNYGLYSSATGGTTNYAGYFGGGDVYIQNKLALGSTPGNYKLAVQHGSYGLQLQNAASGSSSWELYQNSAVNGNLELWTSGGSVGNFNYATGVYSSSSDRNLKDNIQPMEAVLGDVMKLQAEHYTYKADPESKPYFGFIAQEVELIFPQLVTPPSTTVERPSNYTMDYSGFGVLAIKAIQEQQAIIDAQEVRIAKLEAMVASLIEDSSVNKQ